MNIKEAFATILKELRKKKDISQESLGLDAGLQRTFISRLEREINQPSLETIFKIAKVLNVSPHEIVKMVEEKIKEQ